MIPSFGVFYANTNSHLHMYRPRPSVCGCHSINFKKKNTEASFCSLLKADTKKCVGIFVVFFFLFISRE